ncbi:MAG: CoB--CoM heterodisulfide reductase iron-sulfur subunit B family protein [Chloroflexi bacterium]|nr:CoB--CoM heterodisulfide reductase iron-sulfur subunit B family protein [Chloroflexota bacterium]
MKYAFWPGCVSKGACPELYDSMILTSAKLGIELEEMYDGNCTGAGVISEHEPKLADLLNARNFAIAQKMGHDLVNICSTCQGVQSMVQEKLDRDEEYRAEINAQLAEEGLEYKPGLVIKNFMWVLVEDYGLDKLKEKVVRRLEGLNCGPFYGCYILRPSRILGMEEHPERDNYLEQIIEAVGATAVQYEGQDKCCGFPILTNNRKNSLTQAGTHIGSAKDQGADCLVTPCPLCHLNLDAQQPSAAEVIQRELNVPIIHLPQLLGLALGIDDKLLRMNRHVVGTQAVLDKVMGAVEA